MADPDRVSEEQAWALARSWGASREMSPFEAMMWRLEGDPRLRSPVVAVYVFDCVPDWDRLVAAHDWASRIVPRVRQRVVDPPLGFGRPMWATDPDFDLARHLRRLTLPAPASVDDALRVAEALAVTPFDRAHPPWEAVLVDGLDGGRAAYIIKLHHSVTDGQGGIQLLMLLHSRRREPTPGKPMPPPPPPEHAGVVEVLGSQVVHAAAGAPAGLARRLAGVAREAGRLVVNPGRTAGEIGLFARSLQRILTPPPAPPSPLLTGRSLAYRFGVCEVPLHDLRAAGRAAGGTLGDAYVAALLGGFRRYHEHFGIEIGEIPVAVPISLRRHDHPMGGNRFAGARFAAPAGEPDPAERIRAIHDFVVHARAEPALDALALLAPLALRLPPALVARLYLAQSTRLDLQASNVAGVAEAVYVAGARVERMYPFGPLPGCAVMAALVSHAGTCCVGLNCDPAAVVEPELFFDCVGAGFDEVLALAPPAGPRQASGQRANVSR